VLTSPAGTTTGGGILVHGTSSTSTTAVVLVNQVRGAIHDAIDLEADGAFSFPVINATVQGNIIGEAGTTGSGSSAGSGIAARAVGGGQLSVLVQSNVVRQYAVHGIVLESAANAPTLNANVLANTVANPTASAGNGLHVRAGLGASDGGNLCLGAGNNTLTGSAGPGQSDFRLRQLGFAAFRLPGYAGASNNTAAVIAFFQANNPNGGTGSAVWSGGSGFTNAAPCPMP
jgi:hypothetical protein